MELGDARAVGAPGGAPSGDRIAADRLPSRHRRWLEIDRRVATFVLRHATTHDRFPVVTWTTSDPMLTSNGVQLASHLHLHRPLVIYQLTAERGDTEASYRAVLADPSRNFVVLNQPGPVEFDGTVTVSRAQRAARATGFRQVLSLRLPDGRRAWVMWRDSGTRP